MTGRDVELIGISLFGPPPLGEVRVPIRRGVSVLYGMNGAGKTTVLRGMAMALQGRPVKDFAMWQLHLHVHTDGRAEPNEPLASLRVELARGLSAKRQRLLDQAKYEWKGPEYVSVGGELELQADTEWWWKAERGELNSLSLALLR